MKFQEFKKSILQERIRSGRERPEDLAFEIGLNVFETRIKRGMTQKELARKVGTKQPSIARLENGSSPPSLLFLEKVAKALGGKLRAPSFDWQENVGTKAIASNFLLESLREGILPTLRGIGDYQSKQTQPI